MPDLRAAALVAKKLRDILMSGYRRSGLADAIPAEISGHSADGAPSPDPHLAIAPLAFLGRPHASGAVYGFALIPPRHRPLLDEREFQQALAAVSDWNADEGRRELKARLESRELVFGFGAETGRASLDPRPYLAEARVWASCTPVVLDRHLKETANEAREREIAGLLARACTNIGLPPPVKVASDKHSAFEGAPSAYPSGGAPAWMRWRLPGSLASRQLTHAVVEFENPVRGPVLLGAGRFVGLGLMRPLRPAEPPR